jgi:hypothetical protein
MWGANRPRRRLQAAPRLIGVHLRNIIAQMTPLVCTRSHRIVSGETRHSKIGPLILTKGRKPDHINGIIAARGGVAPPRVARGQEGLVERRHDRAKERMSAVNLRILPRHESDDGDVDRPLDRTMTPPPPPEVANGEAQSNLDLPFSSAAARGPVGVRHPPCSLMNPDRLCR